MYYRPKLGFLHESIRGTKIWLQESRFQIVIRRRDLRVWYLDKLPIFRIDGYISQTYHDKFVSSLSYRGLFGDFERE